MAGWDVAGLIRNGRFFLNTVGTSDATAWLDFALETDVAVRAASATSEVAMAIRMTFRGTLLGFGPAA